MKKLILFLIFLLLIPIATAIVYKVDSDDYRNKYNIYNVSNLTVKQVCINGDCQTSWPTSSGSYDQSLNTTSNVTFNKVTTTERFIGWLNWAWIESIPAYVKNYTSDIDSKLNISDQRYNDTVAINTKLTATDQRYNDTSLINALNSSKVNRGELINASLIDNETWISSYTETDPKMNAGNISSLGFNTTSQLTVLYNTLYNDTAAINTKLTATDQRYNESSRIDSLNSTKLDSSDQRYNDTSAINLKLTATDQRYNETSLINAKAGTGTATCAAGTIVQNVTTTTSGITTQCVPQGSGADGNNYPTSIEISGTSTKTIIINRSGLSNINTTFTDIDTWNTTAQMLTATSAYNDTAAIALKLDITDQRYNDTVAINTKLTATDQRYNETTLINAKASPGTCSAGQVVQNTTTSGVQCITVSASGDGTGGWTNDSSNTNTSLKVNIKNNTIITATSSQINVSNFGLMVTNTINSNVNEVSPQWSKHGIGGFASSIGTGNLTRLIGTSGEVDIGQSTVTESYGLYSQLILGDGGTGNGFSKTHYGLQISSFDQTGSGNVGNYYGIHIGTPQLTTTNYTGLYIANGSGTVNNYAIKTEKGLVSFGDNVSAPNINANMSWSYLKDYPAACSAGNAITGLGDSNTCTAFLQTESDPKVNVGNISALGFIQSYTETDPLSVKNNTNINLSNNNKIYTNGNLQFNSTGNNSYWNFTSEGNGAYICLKSMNDGAGHTGGDMCMYSNSWGSTGLQFGSNNIVPAYGYWYFRDGSSYGFAVSDTSSNKRFGVNSTVTTVYNNLSVNDNAIFYKNLNVSKNITAERFFYQNGTELVNGGTSGGATPQGLDGQLQVKNGTNLAGTAVYYVNTLAGLQSALSDNSSSTKTIYITSPISLTTHTNFNLYGSNTVYGSFNPMIYQINTTRVGSTGIGAFNLMDATTIDDDLTITYNIGAFTYFYFNAFYSSYSGTPAIITFSKGTAASARYLSNPDGLTLTGATLTNWKYADIPKTGSNQTLVTGTAGSTGQIAKWDAQGNIYGSTETDPTAVKNGTSANLTQVYINGTDIGDLIASRYNEFSYLRMLEDDQCGVQTTNGEAWYGTAIASGTNTASTGYMTHPCVRALRSSTTASSGYAYNTGTSSQLLNGSETTDIIFNKVSRSGVNMSTTILGFTDSVSATAPVDGVYIAIQNLTLYGRVRTNNAETNTSDSYTIAEGTWYRVRIEIVPNGTQAKFYLYNSTTTAGAGNTVLLWQNNITATLPVASSRQTGHGVTTWVTGGTAAADLVLLDYMNLKIDRVLNR